MREYIVNLTNHLITKNRYDAYPLKGDFINYVANDLEHSDIKDMSPETLGKIMCSLEFGDVMAGKNELLGEIHFSGNPEDTFRELVARCLAYTIKDRLEPIPVSPDTVPYICKRSNPFKDSGFKNIIDGIAAQRKAATQPRFQPKFSFVGYRKRGIDEFVAVFKTKDGNEFYNTQHECEQRKDHDPLIREVLATWPKK